MIIDKYRDNLIPTSQYAVVFTHTQTSPYVGVFNYGDNITKPSLIRYCQKNNIDFVEVYNISDKYMLPTWNKFNLNGYSNIINISFFDQIINLLFKYKYIFYTAGNQLLLSQFSHFNNIIQKYNNPYLIGFKNPTISTDTIKKISLDQRPNYHNYIRTMKFINNSSIKNMYISNTIILNKNLSWMFDFKQFSQYNHDIAYKTETFMKLGEQYVKQHYKLDDRYELFSIDTLVVAILKNTNARTEFQILRQFKKIDLESIIKSGSYVTLFFGGCGTFSNIWKLRFLLMKYISEQYKQLIW